jgi:mannose-6-phosphate isomerase-like protein (cupin superfamily)
MIPPIHFATLADTLRDGYANHILTSVNDHDVHISVMDAPYRWHFHPASDETFIGVEGTLVIDFEDGSIELQNGQMLTIPAGVRHNTRPKGDRSVNLTIEKKDNETVFCDEPAVSN